MIILATAIILSLSNSGIIGKANKAKTDSDTANLKEYVNTLRAEWELMTAEERTESGATTFEDYANKELEKNGYKGAVGADGEVYANLNENARKAIVAGIKVGDTVTGYTIEERSYTTDGSEDGSTGEAGNWGRTVKTNPDFATWKYIGVGKDGSLEIVPEMPVAEIPEDYQLLLGDRSGYLNGPKVLDKVCDALYSVSGVGTAKSMNLDHVMRILEYNGPKGGYHDAKGKLVETEKPIAIGELETKFNTKLARNYVIEGKDLGEYKSDCYGIVKTSDASRITKDTVKQNLVYQAGENNAYWLASAYVFACFYPSHAMDGSVCAEFGVYAVDDNSVYADGKFWSNYDLGGNPKAIRPVVSLNSSVTLTKDTTAENTWNI